MPIRGSRPEGSKVALANEGEPSKICKTCLKDLTFDSFYENHSSSDGLFHDCKDCVNTRRRKKYNERMDVERAGMDRVQKFVQGLLDPADLSDDEICGSYILNDDGHKIGTSELRQKFQPKFNKELSRRLNDLLRGKSPRALEVIFEIIDSDLVEPADRLKASQWWIERIIGKTPEVLLHAATDKPFEAVFEQMETTSREHHRAIEAGVIEVESFEESEIVSAELVADAVVDATEGDFGSEGTGELPGSEIGESDRLGNNGDNSDHGINPRIPVDDPHGRAEAILDEKKRIEELRDRIKKSKKRRYAARAQGVGLKGSPGWAIRFTKPKTGCVGIIARLVPPELQTERDLGRVGVA
jgi:hypothetical protein